MVPDGMLERTRRGPWRSQGLTGVGLLVLLGAVLHLRATQGGAGSGRIMALALVALVALQAIGLVLDWSRLATRSRIGQALLIAIPVLMMIAIASINPGAPGMPWSA